ncbi:flavodoxin family protein [Fusobacterium sp. PH5-44]|uniref:flavodoxin family protein n=1 Tax=unclassified Fusobacterium TaxID=2648384 RepID=UPI003D22F5FE
MKTLIAYSTLTGNTRKVAQEVEKAIADSELSDISDVRNLDYDLIIVGTWIDKGTADKKALDFIKTLNNKKVAFFFTLGANPDSDHCKKCSENITNLFLENNNNVIGHYSCQGAIDPKLIEQMRKMFPADHPHGVNPENEARWKVASTHPDEKDLENAYNYFKNIVK